MTDPISLDEIPLRTLHLDPAEYQSAGRAEKAGFAHFARRLEDTGWLARRGRPSKEMLFIDLEEFMCFDAYIRACRKIHKGNAIRDASKAAKLGYYSKFFNHKNYPSDILAISESAPQRQGHPLPNHYFLTIEEQGGFPQAVEPERVPTGTLAWSRYFGLFRESPDHRQGPLLLGEELLAYAILRRCAEFVVLTKFIGHAGHLGSGIMYKLHLDLIRSLLENRALAAAGDTHAEPSLRGIRYLFNSRYFGQAPGLLQWKRRMLYRPGFFEFDYSLDKSPQSG